MSKKDKFSNVREEIKNKHSVQSVEENKSVGENPEEKSVSSLLQEIALEEDYHYRKIPQMIKADPSSVRLTMMERSREKIGLIGSLRIQLLKKAFRLIIDYAIPDDSKTAVMSLLNLSRRECLRKLRSGAESVRKYAKADKKHSKYYLLDDWDNNEPLIDQFNTKGREFKSKFIRLKKIIHNLVVLRNNLLDLLKEIQDYDDENILMILEKNHYMNIFEATQKMKESKLLNWFEVWGVKRKRNGSAERAEDELSE